MCPPILSDQSDSDLFVLGLEHVCKGEGVTIVLAVSHVLGHLGFLILLDHLLDRERKLLCLGVDVDDHCGHLITDLEVLENLVRILLIGSDEVVLGDESLDVTRHLHEHTEVGDVGDGSSDHGILGIAPLEILPGVALEVLHGEADPPVLRLDTGDLDFDLVPFLAELGHVLELLRPGDIIHVKESVDSILEVDKCTGVGELDHLPLQDGSDRIALLDGVPGVVLELLETKGDPLL